MSNSVIVAGARTPIGKFAGALASCSAASLGASAIAGALGRADLDPQDVDHVVFGHVVQAGAGPQIARRAAYDAGIPMSVPALTVNKLCLSGLNAIIQADQLIQTGLAEVVVAGGAESMSNAPYLLDRARSGYRMGNGVVADSLMQDALICSFDGRSMGESTDRYSADVPGIDRDRQDACAVASHRRAAAARDSGRFAHEIDGIAVVAGRQSVTVADDEGIRDGLDEDALARLRPAFLDDGTITAGNSSQISDGAAAVVVMSAARAEATGAQPLGEIVSYGMVAGPDPSLLHQPARAARAALGRADLTANEIDLFEINEAFAAVSIASMDDLDIPDDIVNVNGGAIALGHPVGASGARLALTLAHELALRDATYGIATLCGGGGQGDAIVLRRASA
jgi:acetyl-CoA C-acetyltransferase